MTVCTETGPGAAADLEVLDVRWASLRD
jgi:hypothetical protein